MRFGPRLAVETALVSLGYLRNIPGVMRFGTRLAVEGAQVSPGRIWDVFRVMRFGTRLILEDDLLLLAEATDPRRGLVSVERPPPLTIIHFRHPNSSEPGGDAHLRVPAIVARHASLCIRVLESYS